MKKVQSQLNTVAKTLANLVEKLEKISSQIAAAPAPKKVAKAAPKKKAPVKKASTKKAPAKTTTTTTTASAKDTVLDSVFDVIKKSRNGATISNLKAKTNLESRQLSNALYKLSKKGKIKSKARGVYIKA